MSPLAQLADLAGILPEYHDPRGRRHETSDATRRALLTAMGIACGDDAEVEASLGQWRERERRLLPPVLVVAADAPIELRLPVEGMWRWRIRMEDGSRLEGRFGPGVSGDEGGQSSVAPSPPAPSPRGRGERLPSPSGGRAGDEGARVDIGAEPTMPTLLLPAITETGYHHLTLATDSQSAQCPLIVCPPTAYQPEAIQGENRVWGLSVQLYGVRSSRNWGIGDFTDLRHLVEWAANAGAGLVGVNPLHALFPHDPRQVSPYRPSSRRFLNPLYLDVEAVAEFAESAEARQIVAAPTFQARLRALRAEPLVDYVGVAAAKSTILECLYRHFRDRHLAEADERGAAFLAWRAAGGDDLEGYALYQALQEFQNHNAQGWPSWPAAYRDPGSVESATFAAEHSERVDYHLYLQWLAEAQLDGVGWRSLDLGLGVGLYQDLAAGVDRDGAETWSGQSVFALAAGNDNPTSQNWIPHALRETAYAPFVALLRANMRVAGALRLDHIMALARRFWRPDSGVPGAYVAYPFDDLLAILALESRRNRCLVVAGDQGPVPDAVCAAMAEHGLLAYRPIYFERAGDGGFKPPERHAEAALVAVSNHDLPTLAGFWLGLDLDRRGQLGLFADPDQRARQIVGRAEDRARILVALEREGLLPEGLTLPVELPEPTPALVRAVHRYLARTPARIALVQAEDMLGEAGQAHLPGTDQYPNWRRKLSLNLEEWVDDPRIVALTEAMVAERGRAVRHSEPVPFPLRPLAVPRATYRLQLNRDFGFAAARALVPYLAELGISHCYCSPYFKARPGSGHGYDIIDHNSLNPEIGDEAQYEAFCAALAEHGMSQIVDLVPNHMGIMGADNAWWLSVLEDGEASAYAEFFDIDWRPLKPTLRDKILVPVLGDPYGDVLERGELRLDHDAAAGEFSVWYFKHRFPVDPREYPAILAPRLELLGARLGLEALDLFEYQSLITAFSHLPGRDETGPEPRQERQRDKAIHKRHLAELCGRNPDIRQFIRENVDRLNGRVGDPASFDPLHALLSAQAWRLAYWRVAADEINYRRFFDINDLAALRMERKEVFEASHRLLFQLLQRGGVGGLRIDHADGLFAPAEYFERLQRLHAEARPTARQGLYVVVEKILASHEHLPENWAVAGTTGYETAHLIDGLFVDEAAAERLRRVWRLFTRERADFDAVLNQSKRAIMKTALASELNVLANRLARIAEMDRHSRDYTLNSLRTALTEIVAAFPVYRTYLCRGRIAETDRRHIEWACSVARKRADLAAPGIHDFIRDVLIGNIAEGKDAAYRRAVQDFAMRLQQYTSPVMAKGMEDTAFYRHFPLAALNEVGADPRRFGLSVAAFHHANQDRAHRHPHALLAGSSHDSKRGEDSRARLDLLSEMPERWWQKLNHWHRLNRARLAQPGRSQIPSRRDEYLFYQTLLGAWPEQAPGDPDWPDFVRRMVEYMLKAVREAKQYSSWANPDPDYETPLRSFVETILDPRGGELFLQDFSGFAADVAHFGRVNSLAQTLLRLTLPGVPDLYQGSELWHLALVDPDNRRPVDYTSRQNLLGELRDREHRIGPTELSRQLLAEAPTGAIKQYLIRKTLRLRRTNPDLFSLGAYQPLTPEGEKAAHMCAYARVHRQTAVVVIVPRLTYTLLEGKTAWPVGADVWGDTRVPLPEIGGRWVDLFTGGTGWDGRELMLGQALAEFPVAALVAEGVERGEGRWPMGQPPSG